MYPVEVFYSIGPTKDYVECAIQTAVNIHLYESEGDILIFLTGEDEIETVRTTSHLWRLVRGQDQE